MKAHFCNGKHFHSGIKIASGNKIMFFSLLFSYIITYLLQSQMCQGPLVSPGIDILSVTNIMLDRLARACWNGPKAISPLSDKLLACGYKELPSLSQQSHQVSESASCSSSLSGCCAFFFFLLLFSAFSITMLLLFTHGLVP